MESHETGQNSFDLTGKLSAIDKKLDFFAKKNNTVVTSPEITYYPNLEHSLENRQIEWIDGGIAKAFMIQPHHNLSGYSSPTWDVFTLAWLFNAPTFEKPFIRYDLLKNASLTILISEIDRLLTQSEQQLSSIKIEELK